MDAERSGKLPACVIPEFCQALREVDWTKVNDFEKEIFKLKLRANLFPNAAQIRRCTEAYGSECGINPGSADRINGVTKKRDKIP